ncbi:uncharacterized protein F54H12.2-like [Ptychodera flava]|uniref:uncharacterized protein F54H12.2-like n=1 Tax=Ptychodera flava TaxID=63121 RepID=UPI00396A7F85
MASRLVDPSSCCECAKEELDIFAVPPTQTSIESGKYIQFNPVSSLAANTPIEFLIPGSPTEYVDLPLTRMHVKARIINEDGTNLTPDAEVGPTNLFLHSLFSQVEISLGGRVISSSQNTYPYRAYIETVLNSSKNAVSTHLTSSLYYKDTPTRFDQANPLLPQNPNEGLVKRSRFTSESKAVDLIGAIHSDIFFQKKHLLNGVDIKIKFNRAKDAFCLMSSQPQQRYRVDILEASLLVRRVKVAPSILQAHAQALEFAPARYPINRVECKSYTVTPGHLSFTRENIFLNTLPKRIVLGLVDAEAYSGVYTRNPFNFRAYGVNYLSVTANSETVGGKPLALSYTQQGGRNYIRAYESLFTGTGTYYSNISHDISREDYSGGNALYAFDLTPDLAGGSDHFSPVQTGALSIEVHFDRALANPVNFNCLRGIQ